MAYRDKCALKLVTVRKMKLNREQILINMKTAKLVSVRKKK
jgi:hypothetical protein